MRKLILFTAALLLSVPSLMAQIEERPYLWNSWIFENDSSQTGLFVPFAFTNTAQGVPDLDPTDGTQWRGFGQIVNLSLAFPWYDEFLTENTSVHVGSGFTDQDYIDQFDGAGAFTVDSVFFFAYLPEVSVQTFGGVFRVLRTNFDFNSSAYRANGYHVPVSGFAQDDQLFEQFIQPDDLKNAYDEFTNNITALIFRFDQPLTFSKGESAIFLYHNEDPAVTFDQIQAAPADPTHRGIGYQEYANGGLAGSVDTRRDPLTNYKSLGLVMLRQGNGSANGDAATDTIHSGWTNLFLGGRSALLNTRTIVFGTVEIDTSSGVSYHFGRDAENQGLGNITPNPVTVNARLPFSLTEPSSVTIELYTASGELVSTLLENKKYIPGNYSLPLPTDELDNGAYLVRMSANENAYSMKFTVTK